MISKALLRNCILLCMFVTTPALAQINSATITADTITALPHCFHFRVKGVCTWLSPKIGINTTPYVEEYLPDLVVTVFNKPGDNPWTEMNDTVDQAGHQAEQQSVTDLTGIAPGSGQHAFSDQHEQNTFYKEADVVGNPAISILFKYIPEVALPSTATPLFPYYVSTIDAPFWRGLPQAKLPIAEEAFAMVADIEHHVGTFPIDWGGLYPHEGKVATTNDAKAAAVIAQRAADLTTNPLSYGHIHTPLSNTCGQECQAASIQENSNKTEYQMVSPKEEDSCDYFGKTIDYGQDVEQQTDGAYAWILWRYYSGCQNGQGAFVGKTIWSEEQHDNQ